MNFSDEFYFDKTVLLAGCGGGYDCFGFLPLFFKIKDLCKKTILVNFSFADRYSF